MPDNRLGDEHNIDLPRQPIANDPEFSVMRMLDGHITPNDNQPAITDADLSNPHTIS